MSKIKVDQIESVDGVADITLNNDLASLSVTGTSTHGGNVTINKDTPSLYVDATANNQNIWFRDNGTNTFGIEVQPSASGGVYLSNRTEGGTYNIRTTPSGGSLTNQVVIGSSGHIMAGSGIVLGNGTSYSASNLLDDYEEGTSTVAVNGITATTNTVNMNYVKVGSLVHIIGEVVISGKSANSGNANFSLPFAPSGTHSFSSTVGGTIHYNTIASSIDYFGLYGGNASVYGNDATGSFTNNYIHSSNWTDGRIGFTLTYTTF